MALELIGHDACYVQIPRTGSRWVVQALENAGVETRPASSPTWVDQRQCPIHALRLKYKNYFTFVRHPQQWYESWWKSFRDTPSESISIPLSWDPDVRIRDISRLEFNDFIRETIKRFPDGYLSRLYDLYTTPPDGSNISLYRVDRLSTGLRSILNNLQIEFNEDAVASTFPIGQSANYSTVWDAGTLHSLLETESRAIQLWTGAS